MTVKELAIKAGIAPTTIYSIIQRDAAIRFDTALRISNILNIPINSICKDNPYENMETLPKLPNDNRRIMIDAEKKAYISARTTKIHCSAKSISFIIPSYPFMSNSYG